MLSANATADSQLRLKYARVIAESCPDELFTEIALTGSSARGIATRDSDIEINFWVNDLPELRSRLHWLKSCGAENIIAHTEPRPDNSYWLNGIYKDIELEAGWQTVADLDAALTDLIEARTTDHKALRLAELVLSAKNLRGSGVLEKWQAILQHYPGELSQRLIEDALSNWLTDNWREDRIAKDSFKEDIHRVWRLIFALNQQWEINWKYAHHSLASLQIYPHNISQRIWDIQQSHTQLAIPQMLALIAETLEFIKTNITDSQALNDNLQSICRDTMHRVRELMNN